MFKLSKETIVDAFRQVYNQEFREDLLHLIFKDKDLTKCQAQYYPHKIQSILHLSQFMKDRYKTKAKNFHQAKKAALSSLNGKINIEPNEMRKDELKRILKNIDNLHPPQLQPLNQPFLMNLFYDEHSNLSNSGIQDSLVCAIRALIIFVFRLTSNVTKRYYEVFKKPLLTLLEEKQREKHQENVTVISMGTFTQVSERLERSSKYNSAQLQNLFSRTLQQTFDAEMTLIKKTLRPQSAPQRIPEQISDTEETKTPHDKMDRAEEAKDERMILIKEETSPEYDSFFKIIQNHLQEYINHVNACYEFENPKVIMFYQRFFSDPNPEIKFQSLLFPGQPKLNQAQKMAALKYCYLFTTATLDPDAIYLIQSKQKLQLSVFSLHQREDILRIKGIEQNQVPFQKDSILICEVTSSSSDVEYKYLALERYCYYSQFYLENLDPSPSRKLDPVGILGWDSDYDPEQFAVTRFQGLFGTLSEMNNKRHFLMIYFSRQLEGELREFNHCIDQLDYLQQSKQLSSCMIHKMLQMLMRTSTNKGLLHALIQNKFSCFKPFLHIEQKEEVKEVQVAGINEGVVGKPESIIEENKNAKREQLFKISPAQMKRLQQANQSIEDLFQTLTFFEPPSVPTQKQNPITSLIQTQTNPPKDVLQPPMMQKELDAEGGVLKMGVQKSKESKS